MSATRAGGDTLTQLDDATRALVRASAVLASGGDDDVRAELQRAAAAAPKIWMEELLLQTYLFAGFPRALNGMRAWRRLAGSAPEGTVRREGDADVRVAGERVCAQVYGAMYEKLRVNVREL